MPSDDRPRPSLDSAPGTSSAATTESVYDTMDDHDLAVERVNTLNTNAQRQGRAERYGIVETLTYKTRDVRTADRYLILVKKASRV